MPRNVKGQETSGMVQQYGVYHRGARLRRDVLGQSAGKGGEAKDEGGLFDSTPHAGDGGQRRLNTELRGDQPTRQWRQDFTKMLTALANDHRCAERIAWNM